MIKVGDAVIDLHARAEGISNDIKNAIETGGSAGGSSVQKSLGSVMGNVGKIGAVAFAAVGTAAVGATTAVVKSTAEVAAYGDSIDKMSQKMGISAQAYQEWEAVMQHSGTSMETLKASMKTMANAAENGNEAFEKLGISEEEVANLSQEALFDKVIAGLQGMEEGTERTYIAGQLLGRGATELGALLNTSAEDTQAMKDRLHELGGVMSDEAVKSSAAYQDTLQDMQTGFESLKRNLVSDFLPGVTGVMQGLTSLTTGDYDLGAEQIASGIDSVIGSINEKLPQFMEVGLKLVSSIANSVVSNLPTIIQTGSEVIVMLINGVSSALPQLIPAVVSALILVANSILSNLPIILTATLDLIKTLANVLLTEGLPMLVSALPDIIVGIVDFILSASTDITNAVVDIAIAVANMAPDILATLVGKLPEIVMGIVSAIISNGPALSDAIMQLTIASLVIVPQIIVLLLSKLPEIFTALINGIKENWPKLKEAGFQAFEEVIGGMFSDNIYFDLGTEIGKFISEGINKIKSFVTDFQTAGEDIMQGLINGISSKIQAAKDKIAELGGGIAGHFKNIMSIGSPSKLFYQFGQFIDEGLVNGITGGANDVMGASNVLGNAVVGGFNPGTLAVNARGGALAGAGGGDIVIPVYIGQKRIETIVVDALNMNNYVTGGR